MIIQDEFAQSPKIPPPALFPRHAAMVENLVRRLSDPASAHGADLLVRKLDAGHCLALMRRQIDAEDFDSAWRPRFIGKGTAAGVAAPRGAGKKEVSTLLPPPIGRQLVSESYKEMFGDAEMAKRGRWHYGSIMLEVPPENPDSPAATFDRLAAAIGRQIPWSVGIEISPNGASSRGMDQLYAGFVGGFGDWNKKVRAAWTELKRRHSDGDYVAAMRLVFTTWAATERECVEHLSFLRSTLESWESCGVSNETGSPALAALCSAAGLTKRNPAPYLPGPISETARMLPMFRPASVWGAGQLVAHTTEGRPYPVAFGSSMQNFWGVLGFAPSGTGKSFTLSMMNFGILFSAGLEEIPPLVVIDVGPGSSYPLRLARSMLPEHRKHEITWMRIRNDKDHTVNPFDTQLGCDEPTEVDRDFQVAVVSTLCPTLGPEGDRFISIVIKEDYRRFGR
jgi:intracellular multiplication protein IcmB